MPARKDPTLTAKGLFGIVAEELDRAIYKPSIFAYKPYSDQVGFHESEAPGKFVSGGNRAGKSTSVVIESIWWATDTHPFRERPAHWGHGAIQQRFVVVDIAKGVEQIILPAMKRWIPRKYLIDGDWSKSWDAKNLILTFDNGSTIDFLTYGMTLEKHGGVPRHIIYFDEEPPQDIFNENLMRLRDYDGWWVISATPVNGMTWTYDLIWEPALDAKREGREYHVSIHELDPANNPHLKAEDTSRFTFAMSSEEREIREKGKFVAKSGLVFPTFQIATHVLPQPYSPPKDWAWYSSVDHGWNNPTAWLWHAVSPGGAIVTFAEHYADHMTVGEHAEVVKARERAWGRHPSAVDMRVGDPALKQTSGITGTSVLQEYQRNGLTIAVEHIPRDVMIGVERMQQYLQVREHSPWGDNRPLWVISPNCPNLIRELRRLRFADYDSAKIAYGKNKREEIHKKDDHAFDSARYFATMMPDLRPVFERRTELLQPGQSGSIWEVHAMRRALEEDAESMVPAGVRWETENYWED